MKPLLVLLILRGCISPVDSTSEVELGYFRGSSTDSTILLSWSTIREQDNYGFEVQKARSYSPFTSIGFVSGNGTTSEPHFYSFADHTLLGGKWRYRLKQIDLDNSFHYSYTITIIQPERVTQ